MSGTRAFGKVFLASFLTLGSVLTLAGCEGGAATTDTKAAGTSTVKETTGKTKDSTAKNVKSADFSAGIPVK